MRLAPVSAAALLFAAACNAQETEPAPAETPDAADSGSAGTASEASASGGPAPVVEIADRSPEETRTANAPSQTPAFEGQTRAPKPELTHAWRLEMVASGFDEPWAIEFLPGGDLIVTDRYGTLHVVGADGTVSEPIGGLPEIDTTTRQGGLLDVALSPEFEDDRLVYLSYSEPRGNGETGTSLARGRLAEDRSALTDVEIIFRQTPAADTPGHFGSRIVFAPDGTLYLGLGDRMRTPIRDQAQNPDNAIGAVARINPDGSIPEDNPFADGEGGDPAVWSYGHRNIQAADLNPETGAVWTLEHGAQGGDEINIPEAGVNYGWPVVTYGENYDGTPVGEGVTAAEDTAQPIYYWDPVIAPGGMDFYDGALFPEWRGDLFAGGLRAQRVSRLVVGEDRVTAEEWLEIGSGVRDVKQGPDGAIWLALEDDGGHIARIVPDHDAGGGE